MNKRTAGFTLIELMIVVTVMAILTGVGIAAYNRFNRKQKMLAAANQFAVDLRLAQKNADSSELPPTGCVDDYITAYSLRYVDAIQYAIWAECTGGEALIGTRNLPEGIFQDDFGEIEFLTDSGGATLKTVTFSITGDDRNARVVVSSAGSVSVEDD
jgi:prepilin-type N-terminal cleavage/methylation domain-containing protein